MFPYLINEIETSYLANATAWTTTVTLTAADLKNAVGPVLVTVMAPAGGSGTLTITPVMSQDDSSFENVPAAAIVNRVTGLTTTLTTLTSTAMTQQFGLIRDQLDRYVSLTLSGTGSQTVTVLVQYARAYTSQAV